MHWLTKYLIVSPAGLMAGLLFAQPSPEADTVTNPLATNPTAATEGKRLYGLLCEECHGASGEGDIDWGGSALNTTGLKHGDGDADLFRTIRSGITGTQMSPSPALSDQQIWQIATYIRVLQTAAPTPAAQSAKQASPAGTPPAGAAASRATGNIAAGESLFFGRASCSDCHEVNARGGTTGPDLSNAARLTPEVLRQKIVSPNTAVAGGGRGGRGGGGGGGGRGGGAPATIVVRTRDGHEIRGVRRSEDTFSVAIVDTKGKFQVFDKSKVASVTTEDHSLMPDDFSKRLTVAEITDVVAYLCAQKGRDPAQIAQQPMTGGLSYERLAKSGTEPQNWLTYWGDYHGTHYSALNQINAGNVHQLRPAWIATNLGGSTALENTPLVVDGVMYVTAGGNPATVTAFDARTGRQIWRWTRQQKVINPYQINPYNRGVAILGNRLFVGTLDAALIALDARTGLLLWEVQVADTMLGHNITGAPLVLKDKVITGIAGGEYATRGFIDAYDPATGKRLWRFNTTPGPGEFGHDTWAGDSWKTGGAPTWLTGSYDPELNLLYWATGNPNEQIDRTKRGELDNLFSCSVVALDPDTGTLKWHYQFSPNDGHDWDSNEDLILVDRKWRGQNRKLLLHADRNGHFYVLDRTNGQLLSGTPFIYQNWNTGFDAHGRPQPAPGSNSSAEGSFLVYPTLGGGTNWQSPSYSPLTGLFYLEYSEAGQQYISGPEENRPGQQFIGRGRGGQAPARKPDQPVSNSGIKALDPETGKTVWDFKILQGSLSNGVLATAGNVLFASTRDGNLSAFDAKTGANVWHFQTGGAHSASPMSYAVDGKQYIALAAGNVLFSFSLTE